MTKTKSNFDFNKFASDAIKQIDSIRAVVGEQESRINAFYRLLGLPMAVKKPEDGERVIKKRSDNYLLLPDTEYNKIEQGLNRRRVAFMIAVENNEIDSFFKNNKQRVDASLNHRVRGKLLPMVADGNIEIMPKKNRVAGAFFSDEKLDIGDGIVYKRPLIETLLYIRLGGTQNAESFNDIAIAYQSEAINKLITDVDNRFEETLDVVAATLVDAVRGISRHRKKSKTNVIPTPSNIAGARKNTMVAGSLGVLDKKKLKSQDNEVINNQVFAIFGFDDSFKKTGTKNIIGDGLTGALIDMIAPTGLPDDTKSDKKKGKLDKQIERAENGAREVHRSLDLLLGTFSGISGVDILITIMAMYLIPVKNLVGLLEPTALTRLEQIKPGSTSSAATQLESVEILEGKVKEIFEQLMELIKNKNPRKRSRKSEKK